MWFYEVDADGWSLDDKRTPLLPEEKLGPVLKTAIAPEEHTKNNLPDVLSRWKVRETSERQRPRTAQSFCVPKFEISGQGYDLSFNRYKEVVHEEVHHDPPQTILRECLRAPGFQRWMEKHTKGVAVRGINLGDVKLMPIILPPQEAQERFASEVIAIEKLKTTQRTSLTELDALFASLQHRAFRGEL